MQRVTPLRNDSASLILAPMHSDSKPEGAHAIIVGAGAFGLAACLELLQRGWSVQIVEKGPHPHPDAASNDISKIVRTDYGTDEFYSDLGDQAIAGWKRWNAEWGWTPFRQEGFLILAPGPMGPGQFEHDSYQVAVARGRNVERLTNPGVRARYPGWAADQYPDGYINLDGGWSPSGAVIEHMLALALRSGATLTLDEVVDLQSAPTGPAVRLGDGRVLSADRVVVAGGSWTPVLLPELEGRAWVTGHPVFHFQVDDPSLFQAPHFGPWAAGTATTGWYGFPALSDGTLKISNHALGRRIDPREPREVHRSWDARFAAFVERSLPQLVGAPIVKRRLCAYTDTFDSDFLIDALPDRPGFVVATGGSGHGFKFTPVLGAIIADAVEGKPNASHDRFGWRDAVGHRIDPARFSGIVE